MKKMPWHQFGFRVILAFLGTIGFGACVNTSFSSLSFTNSIASVLLFASWLYALGRVTAGQDWEEAKKVLNPCFVILLCFSGSMIAGVQLDQGGNVDFGNWSAYILVLCISAAAAPILAAVMHKLRTYGISNRPVSLTVDRPKQFLRTWGILFLSYIPTLLAAFPGFFTYDAEAEAYMVFTEKYSTYQPLLHVILLGWTLRLVYHFTRSYNAGILLYLLVQMGILAACFAYEISFLRRIGVKRWVCNLGTVFLALFPTVSMFVCCTTKDTLFSGGVALFTTLLLEMARDAESFWNSRLRKLLFAASMLFILFFRNNGFYALVVFLVFFAVTYGQYWKKWLPVLTAAFLTFIVATQGLIMAFHARKGPMAEMFSVPIQQLARVYREAGSQLAEEDEEILYSLIPQVILEQYNPKLADMVKLNFMEDNFKRSPGKYISLWLRLGWEHFDIYMNSFLENTYGYWYPDTVIDGYRGIWVSDRQYEDSSYFAFTMENPGERRSFLPALECFYEKISLELYQQRIPVVSMLFSPGFWHWVYVFTGFYLLVYRFRKQAFSLAPIGLLYLTVLLGPIALVRYVLYLFFTVPLILGLLAAPDTVAGRGKQSCL